MFVLNPRTRCAGCGSLRSHEDSFFRSYSSSLLESGSQVTKGRPPFRSQKLWYPQTRSMPQFAEIALEIFATHFEVVNVVPCSAGLRRQHILGISPVLCDLCHDDLSAECVWLPYTLYTICWNCNLHLASIVTGSSKFSGGLATKTCFGRQGYGRSLQARRLLAVTHKYWRKIAPQSQSSLTKCFVWLLT